MPAIDRSVAADIPLFAGLAPEELDEILREARAVRVPKGTEVFEQGSKANSFFVLLHGHLRVEKTTAQGHQIVVRYVSPGEIFGVAQALAMQHYPATAVAVVDSGALCWPSAAWPRVDQEISEFLAANALQTVGRGCRIPSRASWRCRASRSSSVSRTRCCAWRSRPAARPKQASRSTFRSAGKTSPR